MIAPLPELQLSPLTSKPCVFCGTSQVEAVGTPVAYGGAISANQIGHCMTDILSGTSHKYSDGVKLKVVKGFTRSGHSMVWSKCVCEHRRVEDRRQSR